METETGPLNYARFSSVEYDGLMDQANVETDPVKRNDLMRQAEAIAITEMPNIPIHYYISKNLVSKRVQGYVDNTSDRHRTRFLSLAE